MTPPSRSRELCPWLTGAQLNRLDVLEALVAEMIQSPTTEIDLDEFASIQVEIADLLTPPNRGDSADVESELLRRHAATEPPPHTDADAPGSKPRESKPPPAILGRIFLADHRALSYLGDLYVYGDGVYSPGGESLARKWALEILDADSRKKDGDELVYWLNVQTSAAPSEVNAGTVVNVKNGLLDWSRGTLQPHTPDVLSTVQLPTEYHADAYHERGDRFLNEVLPDSATRMVIEEFLGYCLLPDCRYQKTVMLTGEGSNGKSVMLSWLSAMLGHANVSNIKLQDLEHRFRPASLIGKLANIQADLPRAAVEDTGPFKLLADGEPIQAERKNRDPFTLVSRAKMLFSANELPGTRDRSDAFFRRWLIVPFPNRFSAGDPGFDPNLLDKLCCPSALSYLLRLAVDGARRLAARGHFVDTLATSEALAEYRRQADSIVAWFEDQCAYVPGDVWTSKNAAYESYRKWCEASGQPPTAEPIVAKRLRAIDPRIQAARRGGRETRIYVWVGLQVGESGWAKPPEDQTPDSRQGTESVPQPDPLDLVAKWPTEQRRRWAARAQEIRAARGCSLEDAEHEAARELMPC